MTLRVIQWATGGVGRAAIGGIVRHPELELVGCWVHADAKRGKDAGELAGVEPLGVPATHDADALLALEADCVLYSPVVGEAFRSHPHLEIRQKTSSRPWDGSTLLRRAEPKTSKRLVAKRASAFTARVFIRAGSPSGCRSCFRLYRDPSPMFEPRSGRISAPTLRPRSYATSCSSEKNPRK